MSEYDEVSDTSYDAYLEGVAHTQEQNARIEIDERIDILAEKGIALGRLQVANISLGHLVDIMAVTNETLVIEAIQKAAIELAAIVNEETEQG
mgnify:CR=1 FL=1|tara:strand:+ start:606 stop:884 length:279 start_codon:yes stop_codon:yes gene_type:complete